MSSAHTQWIHWRKSIPDFDCNQTFKIKTTNNVTTNVGSFGNELKFDMSSGNNKMVSEYIRLTLLWEIKSINESAEVRAEELKLENCAMKFLLKSGDGDEKFLKWLHLEPFENKKEVTWKTFITKKEIWKLMIEKERKRRTVSWEIIFFGRLNLKISKENVVIGADEKVLGAGPTLNIPCESSSFGTEGSDVNLAIEGSSAGNVKANKYELAGKSKPWDLGRKSDLLSARSPVFRKMLFEVPMKEKASGCINLSDTSFIALKTFVGLMGGSSKTVGRDVLETPAQDILGVLALAHRYQVEGAIDICKMILMAVPNCNMDKALAHNLYYNGKIYDIPEFCTRCFEWIEWKGVEAVRKEGILASVKEEFAKEFLLEYCYFIMD